MNEWEAKYHALAAGIDNSEYIENAEKLVKAALHVAATSQRPFEDVFWAFIHCVSALMTIALAEKLEKVNAT